MCVMENIRRKHMAWLQAVLQENNCGPAELARRATKKCTGNEKLDHSTLSKFINNKANTAVLSTGTIEKLARVSRLPPFETVLQPAIRGLAEEETTPYEYEADDYFSRAIEAIKNGRNGIDPWILNSRSLEAAGYVPGDILMVDLNAIATPGDVICAQIYDRNGRAETVMRIFEDPFLISATLDNSLKRPHLVDNDRVQIRGVVITSLRQRKEAA